MINSTFISNLTQIQNEKFLKQIIILEINENSVILISHFNISNCSFLKSFQLIKNTKYSIINKITLNFIILFGNIFKSGDYVLIVFNSILIIKNLKITKSNFTNVNFNSFLYIKNSYGFSLINSNLLNLKSSKNIFDIYEVKNVLIINSNFKTIEITKLFVILYSNKLLISNSILFGIFSKNLIEISYSEFIQIQFLHSDYNNNNNNSKTLNATLLGSICLISNYFLFYLKNSDFF